MKEYLTIAGILLILCNSCEEGQDPISELELPSPIQALINPPPPPPPPPYDFMLGKYNGTCIEEDANYHIPTTTWTIERDTSLDQIELVNVDTGFVPGHYVVKIKDGSIKVAHYTAPLAELEKDTMTLRYYSTANIDDYFTYFKNDGKIEFYTKYYNEYNPSYYKKTCIYYKE